MNRVEIENQKHYELAKKHRLLQGHKHKDVSLQEHQDKFVSGRYGFYKTILIVLRSIRHSLMK